MRERGIILTPEKVLAFQGGATQMRVPMKPQPSRDMTELRVEIVHGEAVLTYLAYPKGGTARHAICGSPFGAPGDVVWGKETLHCEFTTSDNITPSGAMGVYSADGKVVTVGGKAVDWVECRRDPYFETCQSNHMPRELSRIVRTVKRVWVEQTAGACEWCCEFEEKL